MANDFILRRPVGWSWSKIFSLRILIGWRCQRWRLILKCDPITIIDFRLKAVMMCDPVVRKWSACATYRLETKCTMQWAPAYRSTKWLRKKCCGLSGPRPRPACSTDGQRTDSCKVVGCRLKLKHQWKQDCFGITEMREAVKACCTKVITSLLHTS